MTDMERHHLRRAMYSREAVRTEVDEEGEAAAATVIKSLIWENRCSTEFSVCLVNDKETGFPLAACLLTSSIRLIKA